LFIVATKQPRWDIQLALARLDPQFVEATAETLARTLAGVAGPLPPERGLRLTVKGKPINLGPHVLRILDETGFLIDSNTRGTTFAGPEDFLARSAYSKEAFDRNWDFKRTLHSLRSDGRIVIGQVSIPGAIGDLLAGMRGKTALLSGPPGAAKTMTALRIAHDWAASGGLALVIDASGSASDGGTAADCLHGIQQEIVSQTDLGLDVASRQLLIVIDNAGRNRRFVDRFRSACAARKLAGHSLIITCKPPQVDQFLPLASLIWELAPKLDLVEMNRLAEYARGLPHPPTTMEIDLVMARATSLGYWGALYQLAEPSRRPLEQSILIHSQALEPWGQDIAAYAACFEMLGIPLPLIVLSRIVPEKTRMELRQEMDGGMLGQIVFLGRSGDFDCVRFINPQAAAVMAAEWKTKRPPYALLHAFIGSIGGANEQSAARGWLIHGLAQRDDPAGSAAATILNLADLESLMGEFSDRFPTAATIHHHGRMLRRRRRYEKALRRLEEAIRQPDAHSEKSHISHGIAVTCVRWAEELITEKKLDIVPELLDRAEENLRDVSSERPTFVYSVRAELLVCRARITDHPEGRKQILAQAYAQAKFAQLFARDDKSKAEATRVIGKAFGAMGDSVTSVPDAVALARNHRSAAGFHRLIDQQLGEGPWTRHSANTLAKAASLVDQAIGLVGNDPLLHHDRARLELLLNPESAKIGELLENIEGAGMLDEATFIRAFQHACLGQMPAMRAALASLRERFAGFEVSFDRRSEFLIRDKDGPLTYEVRQGTPNWLQFGGERLTASNWTTGEKVHVEIQPTGPMLRSAHSAAPPPIT
jgi:hypothetical protein